VEERKSIKNHKRGGRTAEKHRETEETAKNKKNSSKLVSGSLGGGREAEDVITR
jgi:hypothetical protein